MQTVLLIEADSERRGMGFACLLIRKQGASSALGQSRIFLTSMSRTRIVLRKTFAAAAAGATIGMLSGNRSEDPSSSPPKMPPIFFFLFLSLCLMGVCVSLSICICICTNVSVLIRAHATCIDERESGQYESWYVRKYIFVCMFVRSHVCDFMLAGSGMTHAPVSSTHCKTTVLSLFSDSQAQPLSHSPRKLITPRGPLNSCTHPTLFSSSSSLPVPSTITSVTLRDRLLSKDSQLLQECFLLTRLKTPFVLGDCWQNFQMFPPHLSAPPATADFDVPDLDFFYTNHRVRSHNVTLVWKWNYYMCVCVCWLPLILYYASNDYTYCYILA